jgi:predicted HTH transcriptional regulator
MESFTSVSGVVTFQRSRSDLGNKFYDYAEHVWKDNEAYTITDFAEIFEIEVRLARYYLMKMVDSGILIQLKYKGNTWYVKKHHRELFTKFKHIGVRIL